MSEWTVFDSFNDRKLSGRPHKKFPAYRTPHRPVDMKPIETAVLQSSIAESCSVIVKRNKKCNLLTADEYFLKCLEESEAQVPVEVCVALEMLRYKAMKELREYFDALMKQNGFVRPREAFNRWLFEALAIDDSCTGGDSPRDVLLPTCKAIAPGLLRELVDDAKHMVPPPLSSDTCDLPTQEERVRQYQTAQCTAIIAQLQDKSRSLANTMQSAQKDVLADYARRSAGDMKGSARCCTVTAVKALCREGVTVIAAQQHEDQVVSHEIIACYVDKLRAMYTCAIRRGIASGGGGGECRQFDEQHFLKRVFCLLQRYRAAAGFGSNEGHGHHAAIPGGVFAELQSSLGVEMECFASPLNSYFGHFCSAFPDTDRFFGSFGSFFDFYPLEGSFEANPPFVEEVMDRMWCHMENLLTIAEAIQRPLSFVIIVPDWRNPVTPCIEKIERNEGKHLTRRFVVPKEHHCYTDGFQHTLRDAVFKPVHDTLVLVCQNSLGARKWVADDGMEAKLLQRWKDLTIGVKENGLLAMKRQRDEEARIKESRVQAEAAAH